MMSTVAPHHYACFCEQCRGIPYREWISREVEKQFGYQAQTAQEGDEMDLTKHRSKDRKQGKFKQRPFLKAKDIAVKGSTAVVIEMREAPKQMEYSDFLLDLKLGAKEFTWGLRTESVGLDMLIDTLGSKTEKWPGKKIKLVRGGPKGQYINVA